MASPQPRLYTEEEQEEQEGGKVKITAEEAVGIEDNIIAGEEEEEGIKEEDGEGIKVEEVEDTIIEGVEGEATTTAGTAVMEAEVGDTAMAGAGAGVTITEVRDSIRTVVKAGSTPGWWRTPGRSWRAPLPMRSTVRRTRARAGPITPGR